MRLPDEHFCYSCLLLPHEAELEAQTPSLIRKRLALAHIQETSPTNATNLMNAMHLSNTEDDHKTFNDIVDGLQQDGYLARGGPSIMSMMNKESAANALREFISPIAHISHHFVTLKDGENENVRKTLIAAALKQYTRGRAYLPDEGHIDYEQQVVEDAFGEKSHRWGFYSSIEESRKRKAISPLIEGLPYKRTALTRNESCYKNTPPANVTTPFYKSRKISVMRKASRCESLVCLDRSSPSTVFSMDEVLAEAIHVATSEAQWEEFRRGGRGRDTSETGSISHSAPRTALRRSR